MAKTVLNNYILYTVLATVFIMTNREIYEKNQTIYNNKAFDYINENLKEKGDMVHRPFEMMTHYSRTICEKITDDIYLVFTGYVKSTSYGDLREIKAYSGDKDDARIYTKHELIRMFGFEISLNPRCQVKVSSI